jgi:hypothetical protein
VEDAGFTSSMASEISPASMEEHVMFISAIDLLAHLLHILY